MRRTGAITKTSAVVMTAALGLASATPSSAVEDETVDLAIPWLLTRQGADGGFGPDTSAAILALAEAGQEADDWVPAEGLAAVEAAVNAGGRTPIDALDDAAEAPGITPAAAAQLVAGAVVPLGLDPADVDPRGDSPAPVDLKAVILGSGGPGGDWAGLTLEDKTAVALGLAALSYTAPPSEEEAARRARSAPLSLIDALRAEQHPDGLWRATGAPPGAPGDPVLTGLVLQALGESGVGMTDFTVVNALDGLARSMSPLGGWPRRGAIDVRGTSETVLGLTTLAFDPSEPCWRDVLHPGWAGVRYNDPTEATRLLQSADGSFGGSVPATIGAIQMILATSPLLTMGLPPEPPELECPDPTVEEAIVHAIYYPVLGRLADAGGTAFFAAQLLEETATTGSIASSMLASPEYARRAVNTAFAALGRRAEPAAVAAFSSYVPGRQHALRATVLGSAEFLRRAGGTNAAFVDALHRHVLNRPARSQESAALLARLANGATRTAVASSVVTSIEALTIEVQEAYISVLGRRADLGGLAFFRTQLQRSGIERVIAVMAASEEFVVAFD